MPHLPRGRVTILLRCLTKVLKEVSPNTPPKGGEEVTHVNTPTEQMTGLHRKAERELHVLAEKIPKRQLKVGYLYLNKDLRGGDMTLLVKGNMSVKLLHLTEKIRERQQATSLEESIHLVYSV